MKEKIIAIINRADDAAAVLNKYLIAALVLGLATAVIVTVGCQNNSKPAPITGADNLRYFHDERTGLCFAAMNSQIEGYASTSITNVPCTDKVLAIIHGN